VEKHQGLESGDTQAKVRRHQQVRRMHSTWEVREHARAALRRAMEAGVSGQMLRKEAQELGRLKTRSQHQVNRRRPSDDRSQHESTPVNCWRMVRADEDYPWAKQGPRLRTRRGVGSPTKAWRPSQRRKATIVEEVMDLVQ